MIDFGSPLSFRKALRIVLWLAVWPMLAFVGTAVAVTAAVGACSALMRLRSVGRQMLTCPAGHANATVGRWGCARCGGQYAGWVGKCAHCGDETADWIACRECALALPLPWRPTR